MAGSSWPSVDRSLPRIHILNLNHHVGRSPNVVNSGEEGRRHTQDRVLTHFICLA